MNTLELCLTILCPVTVWLTGIFFVMVARNNRRYRQPGDPLPRRFVVTQDGELFEVSSEKGALHERRRAADHPGIGDPAALDDSCPMEPERR